MRPRCVRPFEQLVEIIAPGRQLNSTPFFQVVLAVQNTPVRSLELAELSLTPLALAEIGDRGADSGLDIAEEAGRTTVMRFEDWPLRSEE